MRSGILRCYVSLIACKGSVHRTIRGWRPTLGPEEGELDDYKQLQQERKSPSFPLHSHRYSRLDSPNALILTYE
jgi:hypothetical protein